LRRRPDVRAGRDVVTTSGFILARPRLEGLVREVLRRRLTTVVADAGFGKTTLIRAWSSTSSTSWPMPQPDCGSSSAVGSRTP
jgi:hypothetical protein